MKKKPVITVLGLSGRSVFLKVDHFHKPGETVHAESIHIELGGKGYNQAVAAARLGARVNFFTCCGDDEDAKACKEFLEQEGITPYFELCPESSTAFASILTDSRGENQVTVYRGAADSMSGDFIRRHEQVIAESDMLLLNLEYPMEANLAALEAAEKHSVPAILNPAPFHDAHMAFLSRFYLTTPNFSEAAAYPGMCGETIRELAEYLTASPLPKTVVTLGADGALLAADGAAFLYPPVKAAAVDTTGAGDAFNGALAAALAGGAEMSDAVCFAQNAASLSVRRPFVMPAMPGLSEVEAGYVKLEPEKIL